MTNWIQPPAQPRVRPKASADEFERELLAQSPRKVGASNIMHTVMRHRELWTRWFPFASYMFGGGLLPPRERELIILRTAVHVRSPYEWGQHVRVSRRIGMSDDEIRRVVDGPDAGWDAFDAALLRAADELHHDQVVSDTTWATLAERYSEEQMLEVVVLVGQYHLVGFLLNSAGTPFDDGVEQLD